MPRTQDCWIDFSRVAHDLEVSAATLYNWRRASGGMDTDAARPDTTPPCTKYRGDRRAAAGGDIEECGQDW